MGWLAEHRSWEADLSFLIASAICASSRCTSDLTIGDFLLMVLGSPRMEGALTGDRLTAPYDLRTLVHSFLQRRAPSLKYVAYS